MRFGLLRGPLLIALYQAAPLSVARDSLGRYRFAVGYGVAEFEKDQYDCQGNLTAASRAGWRVGGAQLDAWPSPGLRLTAFASRIRSDSIFEYDGLALGGMLAAEGRYVGFGVGVAGVPGRFSGGSTGPALYLRFGNIDRVHFRFDALAPSSTFGITAWGRVGVAFNQGHLRGASGFVGLSGCPYCDEKINVGLFADLTIPATRRLDFTVRGRAGPGQRLGEWGTGFGLRYNFRR